MVAKAFRALARRYRSAVAPCDQHETTQIIRVDRQCGGSTSERLGERQGHAVVTLEGMADETDETITCDAQLLEWFYVEDFDDLGVVLSHALGAEVWFPPREPDEDGCVEGAFIIALFHEGIELRYPMTIRQFLEDLATQWWESPTREACSALEAAILDVEGFGVTVTTPLRSHQKGLVEEYHYTRAIPGGTTVARWRDLRFAPGFPDLEVQSRHPDGSSVAGRTLVSTLRQAWARVEPADDGPSTWDAAGMASRLAVRARQVGLLAGNAFGDDPDDEPESDAYQAAIASVEELVQALHAEDLEEVGIALGRAVGAHVDLDCDDDGPGASATALRVYVYDCITEVDFPFRLGRLLAATSSGLWHSDAGLAWQGFAESVFAVEGVWIRIWRTPWDLDWTDELIDDLTPPAYAYRRAAAGTSTIAAWRRNRLGERYRGFDLTVLAPDGSTVAGQTHLATLRRAWRDAQAPLPPGWG